MTWKAHPWAHVDGMRNEYQVSILARAWFGVNWALGFSGAGHDVARKVPSYDKTGCH